MLKRIKDLWHRLTDPPKYHEVMDVEDHGSLYKILGERTLVVARIKELQDKFPINQYHTTIRFIHPIRNDGLEAVVWISNRAVVPHPSRPPTPPQSGSIWLV